MFCRVSRLTVRFAFWVLLTDVAIALIAGGRLENAAFANEVGPTAKTIDDVGEPSAPRLRLIIVFTPNGVVKEGYWPEKEGEDYEISPVLQPLSEYRDQILQIKGICNRVQGDGDHHMRGMSALLTGRHLFPGNIMGGGSTPAGWASGISIDQEIKNFLQSQESTKTRFGSLEFGVCIRRDANPWTRMVYAGPNQPVAPIDDPYLMYEKMFGSASERENISSVLGILNDQLQAISENGESDFETDDLRLFEANRKFLNATKADFDSANQELAVAPPVLPVGVANDRSRMPELAKMQMDLLVNGFANDMNRVATLQFTESVGNPQMKWIGINEGHHALSHDPDLDKDSQEKLTKINQWYAGQIAYLVKKLSETKEPGCDDSLLDNTLVLWTNELGHGNSHTLNDLPMTLVGGKNFGFKMGRYIKIPRTPHNRLWLAIANAMGHDIKVFGNPKFCRKGPLDLSQQKSGPDSE